MFGLLTVLRQAKTKNQRRRWVCLCACGKESAVPTSCLTSQNTKSCGCLKALSHTKHGRYNTLEYNLLVTAKCRAKKNKIPFSLDFKDIRIPERCPALGLPLKGNKKSVGPDSPSIDRIFPELGYVSSNVAIISHRANWVKYNASLEELEKLLNWMKSKLQGGGKAPQSLEGQVFGRLTVLRRMESENNVWMCRCSYCGNSVIVERSDLKRTGSEKCECIKMPGTIKHGHTAGGRITAEYKLLAGAKNRAKRQGVPFSLALVDIHIPEICPVTGSALQRNRTKPGKNSPSLDRIIPQLGYVPGNVAVVSLRANAIKKDSTLEEVEAVTVWLKKEQQKRKLQEQSTW